MREEHAQYPGLLRNSAAGRANNSAYDGVHQHWPSLAMLFND